ncbi:MAG: OmpA family protein [Saccharospirillaceae bacterium]|nr:OmpA family protein [Pseudomonadales bacterium]NRB79593.1 OmpA family protein [Saccharospirillaceae bacterium]
MKNKGLQQTSRPSAMRRRPRMPDQGDVWLLTFADVITLLLAFFVMLLTISEVNEGKMEELKEGLSQSVTKSPVDTPLKDIKTMVENAFELNGVTDLTEVEINKDGVSIELNNVLLYPSGQATLSGDALDVIESLARSLQPYIKEHYEIWVEGHTDDIPIHNEKFDSNWELSASRATNIVKAFLSQNIAADQLVASGFADSRPKTTDLELSIQQKRELDRRVVIHIKRVH